MSLSVIGVIDYRESMPVGKAKLDGQSPDLYAQAHAAREQSELLAGQLRAAELELKESWQHIQAAWDRAERIRGLWLTARTQPDRLRYSAYARLQARLASMPVIEQAKGIIMAQCGWPEEEAFDALRRASQRQNVKIRDLAAMIVAKTAAGAPARQHAGTTSAAAQPPGGVFPRSTREAAG